MRIDANMQNNGSLVQRTEENGKQEHQKKSKGAVTIKASQLNLAQDSILERKKKAMQDAMEIINKQFKADGKIDQDLSQRRDRIAENKEKANAALKEKQALSEEQEKLKEEYGIEDGSKEQADLELRKKMRAAMKPDSKVKLTEDDMARIQNLGPETEYQKRALELEDSKGVWEKEIKEAQKEIAIETSVIRETKQELLKYHGMDDAVANAEEALKAASDEIMGMLMQEGMDHIQEVVDEAVERGEKLKEEKEEREALLEKKKAEQEELEQQLENMSDVADIQSEVDRQLQEILERQKLLEEDLKGIQVNSSI